MTAATLQAPAINWTLAGTVLALVGLGAIMVASASVGIANEKFGEPAYYFVQHLQALAIGLAVMWLAIAVPVEWWNRGATLLLVLALALLAIVFVPGVADEIKGAKRWVDLGPVGFQASEIARPLLLIYVASYAVRQHEALRLSMVGFARPMALIGFASLLLILEPDYGATVVLLATTLGVLFIAGARIRDLTVTACAATGALAILIYNDATRLDRLLFWLDPWVDASDKGYQLVNSLMAISGNWKWRCRWPSGPGCSCSTSRWRVSRPVRVEPCTTSSRRSIRPLRCSSSNTTWTSRSPLPSGSPYCTRGECSWMAPGMRSAPTDVCSRSTWARARGNERSQR
jgi:cell division protein FtsW (lipid II flippase)